MSNQTTMAVIGAGSWGTALAMQLVRCGTKVKLWGRNEEQMRAMQQTACNTRYLPDYPFPTDLVPVIDLEEALLDVDDILLGVPSKAFRQTLQAIKPYLHSNTRIVWATKGFEHGTGKFLADVVREELGAEIPLAILSGPTFAGEVAAGKPAAITLASTNSQFAEDIVERMHGGGFRVYATDDMAGVQLGGAVKNVFAVAAGVADGLGYGANTRAALITRGLAEAMRLNHALGGRAETLMGLAGLGDLLLTCTDNQSRNRRMGLALGEGLSIADTEAQIGQVVEGVATAREVQRLATQFSVDMPITAIINQVLFHEMAVVEAVEALVSRDPNTE